MPQTFVVTDGQSQYPVDLATQTELDAVAAAAAPADPRPTNIKSAQVGAKGDGVVVTDAAITSGTNTLSSATANFTGADIGKRVAVVGAGVVAQGGVLPGWIKTVTAGVASIVTTQGGTTPSNATATVSGAVAIYGTDDTAAIQAAITTYTKLYAPKSIYVTATSLTPVDGLEIFGDGPALTRFCPLVNGGAWLTNSATGTLSTPTSDLYFKDFWVDCQGQYATSGVYNTIYKGFYLKYTQRTTVVNVQVSDSLATAFGFDFELERIIFQRCYALRSGRMNDGTQPGGSGFGIGTRHATNEEPGIVDTCWAVGCVRYGIFLESQFQSSSQFVGARGWLISNNYCFGNKTGIGDTGSRWTRIVNNHCQSNTYAGVELSGGTVSASVPGFENLIANNTLVLNLHGVVIDETDADAGRGFNKISGNRIAYNTGNGVRMILADRDIRTLTLTDNDIHDNNLSGIRAYYSVMTSGAGGVGGVPALFNGATAYVLNDVVYYSGLTYRSKTAHTNATTPDADATNWQLLGALRWSTVSDNRIWNNGVANTTGDKDGVRLQVAVRESNLDGNRALNNGTVSSNQTFGYVFDGPLTGCSLANNNLRSNLTGGWTFTAAAFLDAATRVSGNIGTASGGGPLNPVAVAEPPGASPWTRTAAARPEFLNVSGGTVSAITVGGVTVASTSDVAVPLEPGDAAVITYTVVPTVSARAR